MEDKSATGISNDQLSDSEKNRYSRNILLDKIGLKGQEKMKVAKVLVIGAGGLGCPVLLYLTAAGVGTIGIIDLDVVDESNLQRQVLFTTDDIGTNKAQAAQRRLINLNPNINFHAFAEKLTTKNALGLFAEYDIIVDGTDNFATRYLVNDACVITHKPFVYGAIYKFEGQISVFNYKNGPTYRCLFPEPPKDGSVPNCAEIGVLGVLPGIIGAQQANETLKIILDMGKTLSGKFQTYNALDNSFMTIEVSRSEERVQEVLEGAKNFEKFDYDFFCGVSQNLNLKEIDLTELRKWFDTNEDFQLVDVRELWEQPRVDRKNVLTAPLTLLDDFVNDLSKDKKVVVMCQSGVRSVSAIAHLKKKYGYRNLINLKAGIANWKD